MNKPELLNTAQAAHYLGLCEMTLCRWRTQKRVLGLEQPYYYRISCRYWYAQQDLDTFLALCLVLDHNQPPYTQVHAQAQLTQAQYYLQQSQLLLQQSPSPIQQQAAQTIAQLLTQLNTQEGIA